jgi:hypothetical protein
LSFAQTASRSAPSWTSPVIVMAIGESPPLIAQILSVGRQRNARSAKGWQAPIGVGGVRRGR